MLQVPVRYPIPWNFQVPRLHHNVEDAGAEEKLLPGGFTNDFINPLWPVGGWRRLGPKMALRVREVSVFYTEAKNGGWVNKFRLP